MKNYFAILLAFLGFNCVLFKNETRWEENNLKYIIPNCSSRAWKNQKFYVYEPNDIMKFNKRVITYLGSDETYHYFHNWQKFYEKNDIGNVAILSNKCNVINPRKIDIELRNVNMGQSWRELIIDSCGCKADSINKK
jgi:hypothetical protein